MKTCRKILTAIFLAAVSTGRIFADVVDYDIPDTDRAWTLPGLLFVIAVVVLFAALLIMAIRNRRK